MIHALAEFSRSQTFEDLIAASFVIMLGLFALYILFCCVVGLLALYVFIDGGIDEYRALRTPSKKNRGPKPSRIPFSH